MTTTKRIAKFVKKLDGNQGPAYVAGDVRLFRLSEPISYWNYGPNLTDTTPAGDTEFVAVIVHVGGNQDVIPQTMVVPASKTGTEQDDGRAFCLILDGWLSHERALNMLGFVADGGTDAVDPDQILEVGLQARSASGDFADSHLSPELASLLGSLEIGDENPSRTGTGR